MLRLICTWTKCSFIFWCIFRGGVALSNLSTDRYMTKGPLLFGLRKALIGDWTILIVFLGFVAMLGLLCLVLLSGAAFSGFAIGAAFLFMRVENDFEEFWSFWTSLSYTLSLTSTTGMNKFPILFYLTIEERRRFTLPTAPSPSILVAKFLHRSPLWYNFRHPCLAPV